MENMAGFAAPKKPAITSHFTLKIAMYAIADTTFLTILQKRENRRNDPPSDIIEMQVG